MKKLSLVFSIFFGIAASAYGAVIIDEDFETWVPAGWTQNACVWSAVYSRSPTHSVSINAGTDYLITPLLTNPKTLKYWVRATAGASCFNVQYCTTSTSGPWTHLAGSPTSTDYGATFKEESFDLSSYDQCYIRFSRCGTKTYYLDDAYVLDEAPTTGSVSVSLDSGSKMWANKQYTFTTTCSDPDGYDDIQYVLLLINSTLDGSANIESFYGYYNLNNDHFYIRGTSDSPYWIDCGDKDAMTTRYNNDCYLENGSTASGAGNTLTVTWKIRSKWNWNDEACNSYLYVRDDQDLYPGWSGNEQTVNVDNDIQISNLGSTPADGTWSSSPTVTLTGNLYYEGTSIRPPDRSTLDATNYYGLRVHIYYDTAQQGADDTHQSGFSVAYDATTQANHNYYVRAWSYEDGSWINRKQSSTVTVGYDATNPPNVTDLDSSSHSEDVWSNDSDVDLTWTNVVDPLSGTNGYYLKVDQVSDTKPTSADTFDAGTPYTFSDLADADDWYFHIVAVDNVGNISTNADHFGPVKIDTTAPSTPGVPTFSELTTDGMLVTSAASTDDGSGLNDDPYQFDCTNDGGFDRGWGAQTYPASGMSENTQYTFRTQARDALSHVSDWGSTASKYTLLNPPENGEVTLEAVDWDEMTMAVTPPPNSGEGSTAAQFFCVSDAGNGNDSGWVTDYNHLDIELSPNRRYGYRVKYRNGDGTATDFNTDTQFQFTLAQPASNSDDGDTVYVTCDHAFSTWTGNNSFTFTNNDNFGTPDPVEKFEYVWDTNPSTDPDGGTVWDSGTLNKTATSTSNSWYLHLKSYNAEDEGHSTIYHMGPFYYDETDPVYSAGTTEWSESSPYLHAVGDTLYFSVMMGASGQNATITTDEVADADSDVDFATFSEWGDNAASDDTDSPWQATYTIDNSNEESAALKISATDNAGNTGSDLVEFYTEKDTTIPTDVGCAYPPDGTLGVNRDTVWLRSIPSSDSQAGIGTDAYYIEVDSANTFDTGDLIQSDWGEWATESWNPVPGGENLDSGTIYYWRVKTRDNVGNESSFCGETDTPGHFWFRTSFTPTADASDITNASDPICAGAVSQATAIFSDPDGYENLKYMYFYLRYPDEATTVFGIRATQGEADEGNCVIISGYGYEDNLIGTPTYKKVESSPSANDVTVTYYFKVAWTWQTEDTDYYYRVRASDDVNQESYFSESTDQTTYLRTLSVRNIGYDSTRNPDPDWFTATGYICYWDQFISNTVSIVPDSPETVADIRVDPDWTVSDYDDDTLGSDGYFEIANITCPDTLGDAHTFDIDIINPPTGAGTHSIDNNAMDIDRVEITDISISDAYYYSGTRYWDPASSDLTSTIDAELDDATTAIDGACHATLQDGGATIDETSGDFSSGSVDISLTWASYGSAGSVTTYDDLRVTAVAEGGNNVYGTALVHGSAIDEDSERPDVGWDDEDPTTGISDVSSTEPDYYYMVTANETYYFNSKFSAQTITITATLSDSSGSGNKKVNFGEGFGETPGDDSESPYSTDQYEIDLNYASDETITATGYDNVDNTSTDTVNFYVDTEYAGTVSDFAVQTIGDDYIALQWTAINNDDKSGFQNYKIYYSTDFASYTSVWDENDDAALGTRTTTSSAISIDNDSYYYLYIVALDNVENETALSVQISQAHRARPGDVVVNEIAWSGTTASTSDEWMELYNITNFTIDLEGWTLVAEDGTPNITLASNKSIGGEGVDSSNSYFLLERDADNTVLNVSADQIYGGALENSPSSELLYLRDSNSREIDRANRDGGNWFAGNNNNPKHSMERMSPVDAGTDGTNWATCEFAQYTNAGGGLADYGTPKGENENYSIPGDGTGQVTFNGQTYTNCKIGVFRSFVLRYTAGSEDMSGGEVEITIPDNWPAPTNSGDPSDAGFTHETTGATGSIDSLAFAGQAITINLDTCTASQYVSIAYYADPRGTKGWKTFECRSKGYGGTLTELAADNEPKANVSIPAVKVNEVFYDVTGEDKDNEWVEIYNADTDDVNFRSWRITDYENTEQTLLGRDSDLTFPAGTFLVLHSGAGTDDTDFSDGKGTLYEGADLNPNWGHAGGDLDSTDQIGLYCFTTKNTSSLADFVAWGGDAGADDDEAVSAGQWTAGSYVSDVADGHSIGRKVDGYDTDTTADWADLGTPTEGGPNEPGLDITSITCDEYNGGPSISEGTWTTDTVVYFEWTNVSGIAGETYYYLEDQTADYTIQTDPGNADGNTSNNNYDNYDLTEGTYYFHVQAESAWGNWGAEKWFRIRCDSFAPDMTDELSSTSHAEFGAWTENATLTIAWTDVIDVNDPDCSGTVGYYFVVDQHSDTVPTQDNSPYWVATGIQTKEFDLNDGAWYVHAVSIDAAGNIGDAGKADHFGPIKVDATAMADKAMRVNYVQYVPSGKSNNHGDCMLYELPNGKNLLIDGGDEWASTWLNPPLRTLLDSKIGEGGTLYYMVLTTPGIDSGGGLTEVLGRYDVDNYYETSQWTALTKVWYGELWSAVTGESGLNHYDFVSSGEHAHDQQLSPAAGVDIGPGWDADIDATLITAWDFQTYSDSHSEYGNHRSSIIKMAFGGSTFLCGGDSTGSQSSGSDGTDTPGSIYYPEYYGRTYHGSDLNTDIYAVSHQGSDTYGSNGVIYVKKIWPQYGIVQIGYKSTSTNPEKEVMDRLYNAGAIVYRNDLDGTVLVKCDNRGNYDITRDRAYIDEDNTPGAVPLSDQIHPPPGLPTELIIDNTDTGTITLSWRTAWGEDTDDISYDIFRSDTSGGWTAGGTDANPLSAYTGIYKKIGSAAAGMTTFTDSGLTNSPFDGTRFYYRISAKKTYTDSGDSVIYERRYSNESAATAAEWADTTDPEQITDLAVSTGSAFGNVNLSFTAPHEDGGAGGKCMYYIIKYKETSDFTSWTDAASSIYVQTWAPDNPGISESLNLEDFTEGTTYYFALRAYDEYGNASPMSNSDSTEPRTLSAGDVVINEIAWKGSKDYGPLDPSTDEYIELYNTTAGPIDLAGWSMNFAGGTTVNFTIGTGDSYIDGLSDSAIQPHGYFLIENDSDSTNVAHNITDAGMDIADGGQNLYLWASAEYGSILIDYVSCGSDWYAGTDAPDRNTMERIYPEGDSNEAANWADYSVDDTFGDYYHNQDPTYIIYGTPGNPNSVLNEPPQVEITVDPVPTWVQETWAVSYRIRDPEGTTSSIDPEFSTDGSVWHDASGNPKTGLSTNTDGVSWTDYTFFWNTDDSNDLQNYEDATVYFRIRPYDYASGTVNFMGDTDVSPGTFFGVDNKGPSTPGTAITDVAVDGMSVFLYSESTDGGIGMHSSSPYYFECTTDGSFDRTWGDQTHEATGMNENIQYTFRSLARDDMTDPNLSDWSNETSRYTLLDPPQNDELILEAIDWNRMSMAVVPPPNSAAGSTAWQFLTGDTNPGGANNSSWQIDPNYDRWDEDLLPNREYGWKVRYRNGDGVNTDPNPNEQLKYTLAQPPSNFVNETTVQVTCDHSFSTCTENATFTFTNEDGFVTPNPVEYFEWVWDTDASTDPTLSGNQWTSGFLTQTATHEDTGWYLHLVSYNADDAVNPEIYHMGPFCFMPVPEAGELVFNEIAWMGTAADPNDEWIELYNATSDPLYLGGCKIYGGDTGSDEIIELFGTIEATSYYLIERTDNTTVNDIWADQTGAFSPVLNNNGAWLKLKNADGDTVDSVDCSGSWFAGCTGYYYRTMERFNPSWAGDSDSSWHPHNFSNDGEGLDAVGNDILGTPRTVNSNWTNAAPTTCVEAIMGVPEIMESGYEYEIWCTFSDNNGYQDFGRIQLTLDNGDDDIVMPTKSPDLTGTEGDIYCDAGGGFLISPGGGACAKYQVIATAGTALDTGGTGEGSVTVKWIFTPDWDWTESTCVNVVVEACDADMECTGSFTADTHPAFYFDTTTPNIIGVTSDSTHVVNGDTRGPAAGTAFVRFTVTETGSGFDEGGGLTLHYLSNGNIGSGAITMNQSGASSPWTFISNSSIPIQTATQDQIITFWATGSDDEGNILTSSLSDPTYLSDDTAYFFVDVVEYGDVVINEIAWMGTEVDYNDEWIELYNNTDVTISLNNWILNEGSDRTLSGSIDPKGYFLIERAENNTSVASDDIVVMSLDNDGELILLKDSSGNQIDRANNSGTWFAGANPSGNPAGRATMERRSPEIDGVESSNWQTFTTCPWAPFATDAAANDILGTPRTQNSCYIGVDTTGPYFDAYYFRLKNGSYREEVNPSDPANGSQSWGDFLTPDVKISTADAGVGNAPIGAPVWNDYQSRGYWHFNNNGNDDSLHNHTLSASGVKGTNWDYNSSGRFHYCLDLLGGGYMYCADTGDDEYDLDGYQVFSIEAWIYPDWDNDSGQQAIVGKEGSYYFRIDWDVSEIQAVINCGGNWTKVVWVNSGYLNPSAWNHVAFTWQSGTRGKLYIDTVQADTGGSTTTNIGYGALAENNNQLQVGAYLGSENFRGRIDALRISEKVRSTSEFTMQNNAIPFRYRRDANDSGWGCYSDYAGYLKYGGFHGTTQDFSTPGDWNTLTYAGSWSDSGGVMTETSNSTAWNVPDNLLLNNLWINADVKTGSNGAVGVVFRKYVNSDNCYIFAIRPQTSQCYLILNNLTGFDWDSPTGTYWAYGKKFFEKDSWHNIKVAAVENNIRILVDDEPVIFALDAGAWANGFAGLYSWENTDADFDNFTSIPLVTGRITGWEGDTDLQAASLSRARFNLRSSSDNQAQMLAFDLKDNMAWSEEFHIRLDPDEPEYGSEISVQNALGEWAIGTTDSTTPNVRVQVTDDEVGLKAKRRFNDPDEDTLLYFPFIESWPTQGVSDYSRYINSGWGPYIDPTDFSNHTVANNWNSPNNGFDWCLYYDGNQDFVRTQYWYPHVDFNGDTSLTVEAWFKSDTTGASTDWDRIVTQSYYDSGMYGCFEFSRDDADHLRVILNTSAGWKALTSPSTISADTWHYGAFSYDGETIKLYMDGVLENSTDVSGTIATSFYNDTDHWPIAVGDSYYYGRLDSNAQAPWHGYIDDLRISGVVRSEEEIKLRYPTEDYNAIWQCSTDAGGTWSDWTYAHTSDWADYTTNAVWAVASDVPFNQTSSTDNLVRFAGMDMAGNVAVSDPYTVICPVETIILINEVAFKAQTDWVELYVKSYGGEGDLNIQNWTLDDLDSWNCPAFTTETLTAQTGDYIVVHLEDGTDETDATGKGGNGYWDIYVGSHDLTGTDDGLGLKTAGGNFIDVVFWSDNSGGGIAAELNDFNEMAPNQWIPSSVADWSEFDSAAWTDSDSIDSTDSICRDGLGTDTDTKADWYENDNPNPGEDNEPADVTPVRCWEEDTWAAHTTQIAGGAWHNEEVVTFDWDDPSSLTNDTFYYEISLNAQTDVIEFNETEIGTPYVDNFDLSSSEGTYYFHVASRTGSGKEGPDRMYRCRYDGTAPLEATALNSPTHTVGVWNNQTDYIEVTWTDANDDNSNITSGDPTDFSGVRGYYYLVNDEAGALPDTDDEFISFGDQSAVFDAGDGIWYVHLRSIDNAGNIDDTAATIGPFKIDIDAAAGVWMRKHFIQWVPEGSTGSYGDCEFLEFPNGENALIDGGGKKTAAWGPDPPVIEYLEDRIGEDGTIYYMVLSTPGADSFMGLYYALNEFDVKNYYETAHWTNASAPASYTTFSDALSSEDCNYYYLVDTDGGQGAGKVLSGSATDYGPGWDNSNLNVKVLAAWNRTGTPSQASEAANDRSVILKLNVGRSTFLTGADATATGTGDDDNRPITYMKTNYRSDMGVDIWKFNHQGSIGDGSNSVEELQLIKPKYAIAQIGYGSTGSLPNAEALNRANDVGALVYRNDLDGTVLVKCDNRGNYDITRDRAYESEGTTPGAAGDDDGDDLLESVGLPTQLIINSTAAASITLSWDAAWGENTDEVGYHIYRSKYTGGWTDGGTDANPYCAATGIYKKITSVPRGTTTFTDTGLTGDFNNQYYYRISAWVTYTDPESGYAVTYERRYSNETTAKPGEAVDTINPGTIYNANSTTGDEVGSVDLSWTAPHEDGTSGGRCRYYILKYSNTAPVTDGTAWNATTDVFVQTYYPIDPENTDTISIYNLDQELTYYYSVRAYDEYGNASPIAVIPPVLPRRFQPGDVVFNEVGWMGTNANSAHTYLELYNNLGQYVDLWEWGVTIRKPSLNLYNKDAYSLGGVYGVTYGLVDQSFATRMVADPNGYFLLEYNRIATNNLNESGVDDGLYDNNGQAEDNHLLDDGEPYTISLYGPGYPVDRFENDDSFNDQTGSRDGQWSSSNVSNYTLAVDTDSKSGYPHSGSSALWVTVTTATSSNEYIEIDFSSDTDNFTDWWDEAKGLKGAMSFWARWENMTVNDNNYITIRSNLGTGDTPTWTGFTAPCRLYRPQDVTGGDWMKLFVDWSNWTVPGLDLNDVRKIRFKVEAQDVPESIFGELYIDNIYADITIDELDCASGWFAGTDNFASYTDVAGMPSGPWGNSMERIFPAGDTNNSSNWADFSHGGTWDLQSEFWCAEDALSGGELWIYGTPGSVNSVYTDRYKDTDHDGMWDIFENQDWSTQSDGLEFIFNNANDAMLDWDGDGFTNLQEFWLRTDPTDDTSYFRLIGVGMSTNNLPTLTWTSWNRQSYSLPYFSDRELQPQYDIIYVDLPVSSWQNPDFFSDKPDWFNQTATWSVLPGSLNIPASPDSTETTWIDVRAYEIEEGAIRFYRIALHATHLEGDFTNYTGVSQPGWDPPFWYTANYGAESRRVSIVTPQIMLIQTHEITDTDAEFLGMPGDYISEAGEE